MNRVRWQIVLGLALVATLPVGCTRGGAANKTVVRVTPANFSAEELKQLHATPDLLGVRVDVDQRGTPLKVAINVKSWWNGNQVNSGTEAAEEIPDSPSVSTNTIAGQDSRLLRQVTIARSTGHHSTEWILGTIPIPSTSHRWGKRISVFGVPDLSKGANPGFVKTQEGPVQLTVDHPVPVWAYIAGRGVENKPEESIDATIAHSEWALVVTMTLEKGK